MSDSDLIRGNIDTVILKVLYEGDRYGYDMIKLINARSGGQWEIKQPTLYACLKRLEKKGFVASYWDESSNGGRRKYYSLTDEGKEVFVAYKADWERTRDLFGGLINEDDPILPSDDFSDVEDETYSVPKRRPQRKKRPAQPVHISPVEPEPAAEPTENIAATEEIDETEEIEEIENIQPNIEFEHDIDSFPTYTVDKPASAETVDERNEIDETTEADEANGEAYEQTEQDADERIDTDSVREYIQENFLETNDTDYSERIERLEHADDEDETELYAQEQAELAEKTEQSDKQTVEATDPRALLDELFASATATNESYSSARGKYYTDIDESDEPTVTRSLAPQRTEKTPATFGEPTPAPYVPPVSAPAPYTPPQESAAVRESAASLEYKEVLRGMVENSESINSYNEKRREEEAASVEENKNFEQVAQAMSELGNDVTVRTHNDSAKEYSHKYYYYSRRLMLNHYAAMCAIMFLLGLTLFLTFYVGAGMRMKYDYILYTFAGLLPIVMFIVAVILFAAEPDRKKRINVNFRFSYIIRSIIALQVLVVIYCCNLIWGMPVSFSAYYVPSLVIPAVYALFIPVSEAIFMLLLKSNKYAVE